MDDGITAPSFESLINNQAAELFEKLTPTYGKEIRALFPSPKAIATLSQYAELLERWTTKIDLVAPSSREMLVSRHLIDCIGAWAIIQQHLKRQSKDAVLDVGSGAGLPGLVIASLEPTRPLLLCEPREKRCLFLEEARRKLGLERVVVLRKRIEEIRPEEVVAVTLCITRATGFSELLLKESRRLLKRQAWVIEMATEAKLEPPQFSFRYEIPPDSAKRLIVLTPI